MERKILSHAYETIISVENLLLAWQEFIKGKKKKLDVQIFQYRLMDNILDLHNDLKNKTYSHGPYKAFNISDPKPRNIHKASVRDRLLHHAIYRILYPFFDNKFISNSFSCRKYKGTHKALKRFKDYYLQASQGKTKTVYILKCDIRKFFASIDHSTLMEILKKYITDQDVIWLLTNIINSFSSTRAGAGLPLGNLTSQLLVNIYMNEFDQSIKHILKVRYYIRYADDFVIFSENWEWLDNILTRIQFFLENELKLKLHPDKVFIKTAASGVDFLGWVNFPYHQVLRTATKKKMFRKLSGNYKKEVVSSYLGMLGHGNGYKLQTRLINQSKIRD
jgi:retron-type reverse transcriptase